MDSEPLTPAPEPQPLAPQDQPADLNAEVQSLHHLLQVTLLLTILVAGTLVWFFHNQAASASAEAQNMRVAWTNTIVTAQRAKPLMEETLKKLQDFSKTNPDYGQILAKYGMKPGPTGATPTATPAGKK